MSVLEKLASSLGRRDDVPNQQLARELAESEDAEAIEELVENLSNKDRNIQSDCIKVLYEIGYIRPELIAGYVDDFLGLLKSKNNRLVWGGMIALSTIAELQGNKLYRHLDEIKSTIDRGSVITVDRGIKTLSILASQSQEYRRSIFPYLLQHLRSCRPKDFPQRAEYVLAAVDATNKDAFLEVIQKRIPEMKPSQVKRLKRVLASVEKL